MPSENSNPYAVTPSESDSPVLDVAVAVDSELPVGTFHPSVVSTPGMVLGAVLASTGAGGSAAGILALVSWGVRGEFVTSPERLVLAILASIALGAILALLGAMPAVLLTWLASVGLRQPSGCWTIPAIRIMYAATAGLSGLIVPLVLGGEQGITIGLIAGMSLALVASGFAERKIRRALAVQPVGPPGRQATVDSH